MKIINYDFKDTFYFKFEVMTYVPFDPAGTYTITSFQDIDLKKDVLGTGAYECIKHFLVPYTDYSIYNYDGDYWDSIWGTMNTELFDDYIVGVEGTNRRADNIGDILQITGWINHTEAGYEGYLFNDYSYVVRLAMKDILGGDAYQYVKDVGKNSIWGYWLERITAIVEWEPYGLSYAVNKYNISEIDDTTATKLINDTLIYNNDKSIPLYVSTIKPELLPEEYVLSTLSVDYSISSKTVNNSVTCRLLDGQGREWLYSEANGQWEYIGQAGGEWATDDGTYQTISYLNDHLDKLTSIDALGVKLKIVSDNNDITLNRISYSVNDTTEYPNTKVRVYGNIKDIIGVAQEDVIVQATPSIPQGSVANDIVYTGLGVTAKTDNNGAFEIEVMSNSEVVIFIPIAGFRSLVEVGTDDVNLAEYIESIYG